jgi:uncharacterized protein (TIGR00290 family)
MHLLNNNTSSHKSFCSWSGGKDSCLALYRLISKGYHCNYLFTMLNETGNNSRSHSIPPSLLAKQAMSIGIPGKTAIASWNDYENVFIEQMRIFSAEGITHGIFGDIDLEPHKLWEEKVCSAHTIAAVLPLWKSNRRTIVEEFVDAGFKAIIVVINTNMMPAHFLGREIDKKLIEELESIGVDACGENGEYHSFVYDGPLFSSPVDFNKCSILKSDNYVFLDLN